LSCSSDLAHSEAESSFPGFGYYKKAYRTYSSIARLHFAWIIIVAVARVMPLVVVVMPGDLMASNTTAIAFTIIGRIVVAI
jgi:hypothetical protein